MKKAQMSFGMKILISLVVILALIIIGLFVFKPIITGILGGA